MESELENGNSSPPNSHSASEMYVNELEKDMQRFKNEIDVSSRVAGSGKRKCNFQKSFSFSLALVFLFLDDVVHFDFPFMDKVGSSKEVIL